jgi:hypothetical protein
MRVLHVKDAGFACFSGASGQMEQGWVRTAFQSAVSGESRQADASTAWALVCSWMVLRWVDGVQCGSGMCVYRACRGQQMTAVYGGSQRCRRCRRCSRGRVGDGEILLQERGGDRRRQVARAEVEGEG